MKQGLVGIILGVAFSTGCGESAELSFVECLADKGVHGYSSWLCGPCRVQKEHLQDELGEDWPTFNEQVMIECYESGKITEKQICKDEGIAALPAWDFPQNQGTVRKYGILSIDKIAEYSGCEY